MFLNTLFLRALAHHCLKTDLWKEYLSFLVCASFPDQLCTTSVLIPVPLPVTFSFSASLVPRPVIVVFSLC